jgi:hypothetical protein
MTVYHCLPGNDSRRVFSCPAYGNVAVNRDLRASIMQTENRLIPLSEWNRFHEWPPQGGLRHLRHHCKRNGFAGAFVKCGRRVLIQEKTFFDCVAKRKAFEESDYEADKVL